MGIVSKIHHVAYRCKDAKETVEWYGKYLDMKFVLAIAEDQVPSTKDPDPYMHIFMDAGGGNILAFFELPTKAPRTPTETTPITSKTAAKATKMIPRRRRGTSEDVGSDGEVVGVT